MLLAAMLAGGWLWLDNNRPEVKPKLHEIMPARVEASIVARQDVQPVTRVTGRLVPARITRLNFEISGRLTERHVEVGQQVTTGDVLMRLDGSDLENAVAEKQSRYEMEKAAVGRDRKLLQLIGQQITLLQREISRQEKLKKTSLSTQARVDEVKQRLLQQRTEQGRLKYSVETAESRLRLQELALTKAKRDLQRTVLKAPFRSVVNAVWAEVGEVITPATNVVELVDRDNLDLAAEVTSQLASALKIGQTVTVRVEEKQFQGKLIALAFNPDPGTLTHSIKIRLEQHRDLIPGQLAEAFLPGRVIKNTLTVPITAVLHEDGESFVFRINGDQVFRIPVSVQGRDGERLLIDQKHSSIKAGDRIVATDVAALEDGQKVVIGE